jgi:16S rRNA (adenine1518-N6/adenine1519-N6)-dimethyltransferase
VYVAYWATVKRLFAVPRRAFWPVPEVSSALVRITRRPERRRTAAYPAFSQVVMRLLGNRRKTLASVLRTNWDDRTARQVTEQLGVDPRARPETLTVADFEAIASLVGPPTRD